MSSLQADDSPIDLQQDGQWLWSSFSVWHVNSNKIADCLQTLHEPSVLLTSEDGMRWYLRIFQGGEEHVRLCHEFGLLGTSEQWEEEPDEDERCAAGICQFDDDFEQLAFLWDEVEAARVVAQEQAEMDGFVPGKEIVSEQQEFGCTLARRFGPAVGKRNRRGKGLPGFPGLAAPNDPRFTDGIECGVRPGEVGRLFFPPAVYR